MQDAEDDCACHTGKTADMLYTVAKNAVCLNFNLLFLLCLAIMAVERHVRAAQYRTKENLYEKIVSESNVSHPGTCSRAQSLRHRLRR